MKNKVFIDGYIADKNGGTDWLHSIPNPDNEDMGYAKFMADIDALVMGRNTFDTICAFDMEWPYKKPVFVLSNTMKTAPEGYQDKVELLKGDVSEILKTIHEKGHKNLYIDGGKTIQRFLKEGAIDEMTITVIPYLLGGGIPLFTDLPVPLRFECVESKNYLGKVAQHRFVAVKSKESK